MKKTNLILTAMLAIALCFTACSSDDNDNAPKITETVNGVTFEMVAVDGGTFTMGGTSEQGDDIYPERELPTHSVTLSSFVIGKHEVTQGLWMAVMGSYPGTAPSDTYGIGDNYPVYNVSWDDVQTFITKLNELTGESYRLPTDAEWEYAARGGKQSMGYKYSGSNTVGDVAWYSENSGVKTNPVGTKQANELGIYDMSGNVWEWCADWYGAYTADAVSNPTGSTSGSFRVNRGGSWHLNARLVRVSVRNSSPPSNRNDYLGFRLAR